MLYISYVSKMCDDSSTVISLPPSQSPPPSLLLHALLHDVFPCAPQGTEVRCNHAGGVCRIISAALLFLYTQTGWGRDRVTCPPCVNTVAVTSCHISLCTLHKLCAPVSSCNGTRNKPFQGTKANTVPRQCQVICLLCVL